MEPGHQLLRALAKSGHVLSGRSGTHNVAHGKIRAVPSPGMGRGRIGHLQGTFVFLDTSFSSIAVLSCTSRTFGEVSFSF